ncbi:MAG TPA: CotH kinase family protein [Polyangiaceae bacterium]|nr:CotH kinase family protein [Polyangiaceae bacterium]
MGWRFVGGLALAGVCGCGAPEPSALVAGASGASEPAPARPSAAGSASPPTSESSGSAPSSASAPAAPPAPGDVLFAAQTLDIYLTLEPAALNELEEHGNLEQFVPAAARVERAGEAPLVFEQLGVRHKGADSLHRCWDENGGVRSHVGECQKLSLKLDFDRYDGAARLDGLKQLNLHASVSDLSRLRELVAYQTFREAGVVASRALPAQVFVNGERRGLFIAVEEVDGRFTRVHFPIGPDGNLYKEAWPNVASSDEELALGLRTNEAGGDVSGLRAFAEAVARAASGDFDAELEPFVELEALLRYVAVDRALINWDGIMAFYSPRAPHNFYWYHDDGPSPRFHLIPWDLDGTFWPFDPYMRPEQWVTAAPVPDFNARPLNCEPRPIWQPEGPERITPPRCDALLDGLATQHWARFAELGQELLDGPLSAARLVERVESWRTRVEPLVLADPTLDPLAWQRATLELREIMGERAASFAAFLAEGLIDEGERVVPEAPLPDEPDVETPDTGLLVGALTNFEFDEPPSEPAPEGAYTYADPLASVAARWSTDEPLSGQADLRFDFTFNRGPDAYDEWAGVGLSCAEADARPFSTIVVMLAADVPRQVRVRIVSPAYDEAFGGVLAEFGQDIAVGPEPRAVALPLADFYYPSWAKEDWAAGQGFPATDREALDGVLARFGGLNFDPRPTLNAVGELTEASEDGYLRIDNIHFLE